MIWFVVFAILAILVVVFVVELVIEHRRRVDRLAWDFGLERRPGESTASLRRRTVDRATLRYGRRS